MDLYAKYHIERDNERRELFRLLRDRFRCRVGMYPGCFVHVTPSFYLPSMIYVDSDRRVRHFFRGGSARRVIDAHKTYGGEPELVFYPADYRSALPIPDRSVDLLVSQFAGFVSDSCTRYLSPGGILVANDSHGDAGLAHIDPAYEFIGVVTRQGNQLVLSTERLDRYFVRAATTALPDRADVREYLKGLGQPLRYQKTAEHYLFRKR